MLYSRKRYTDAAHAASYDDDTISARARAFADDLRKRRSVRQYSGRKVPREALEQIVWAAASAPSGANQQPWHFAIVTSEPMKRAIRLEAERQEAAFYDRRAPDEWRKTLAPLGTNADKAFLDDAAALVVVFVERWGHDDDGNRVKRYYPKESVGIAAGMLVAAAHMAGLATLTYTPSPMGFLNSLLGRGDNEVPFLILAVGHPAADATVPDIEKKPLAQVASFFADPDERTLDEDS